MANTGLIQDIRKNAYRLLSVKRKKPVKERVKVTRTTEYATNSLTFQRLQRDNPDIIIDPADRNYKCRTCGLIFKRYHRFNMARHCKRAGHCNSPIPMENQREADVKSTQRVVEASIPLHGSYSNTLPSILARRMNLCRDLLKSGIPFENMDTIRSHLAECDSIGGSDTLRAMIPAILDMYVFGLLAEIRNLPSDLSSPRQSLLNCIPLTVIFDSSSVFRECYVFTLRYVDSCFNVHYRTAKAARFKGSNDQVLLSKRIIQSLFEPEELGFLKLDERAVLSFVRDGIQVNHAGLKQLSLQYCKGAFNITCSAHAMDIAGKKFEVDTLDTFWKHYEQVFLDYHENARNMLSDFLQIHIKTYSKTRWWSMFECLLQLFKHIMNNTFYDFIMDDNNKHLFEGVHGSAIKKIVAYRGFEFVELLAELGAVVTLGEVLCKTTYHLESDGTTIFELLDTIQSTIDFIQNPVLTRADEIAKYIDNLRLNNGLFVDPEPVEAEGADDDDDDSDVSKKRKATDSGRGHREKIPRIFIDCVTVFSSSEDDVKYLSEFKSLEQIQKKVQTIMKDRMKAPIKYLKEIYLSADGRMNDVTSVARVAKYFHPKYKDEILALSQDDFHQLLVGTKTNMTGDLNVKTCTVQLFQDHGESLVNNFAAYKEFLQATDVLTMPQDTMFQEFWRKASEQPNLETFSYCAKCLLSITPSSASVERCFSQLKAAFTTRQSRILTDAVYATILVKNNPQPDPNQVCPVIEELENLNDVRVAREVLLAVDDIDEIEVDFDRE